MKKGFIHALMVSLLVSLTSLGSCTTARESEVEDELSEFRNWVNRETSQLASRTEEDWEQAKQDFKVRTRELDQKQEQFSEELQEEYRQLKQEFTEADESYESVRQEALMAEWGGNCWASGPTWTRLTLPTYAKPISRSWKTCVPRNPSGPMRTGRWPKWCWSG
ncbi:hypothetical protein [Pontibacter russatus]|uniref:hypothetical protein n=1 Tax=Pontibacter russatus TaxID=2694929 RepID=UPI001379E272|nr:hypothetical protein [Pontibacter russatus]